MRKYIISLLALLFCAQLMWAVEPSTSLTVYYASIDGKTTNANDDLRKTLCTVISAGYTSIGYSSLQSQMYAASSDPTDFVNGENKTMEDIYSSKPYKSSDNGSSASSCGAGWNKEHTVPQSWFNEQSPMKSDAFHVYPTDIKMNSVRSSYPYGENNEAKSCSSWGYGSLGNSTFPGYTGTVFDPGEGGAYGSYKGDLARTYFYMATRYRTTNFTNGSGNTSFTYSGGVADLTDYMKNLMLKWHREDPVSEKELNRNNAIYAHQHNRNPFIDYPELVEYIWGTKKGQTVQLTALVSGYDDDTTHIVPPVPATKYAVTWSVNGTVHFIDSIEEGGNITVLPATPISCSTESPEFVGWTNAAISGIADEAPAVLYNAYNQFPAVTEDVTYYAVFAQMEEEVTSEPQIASETIVLKDKGYFNAADATSVEQGYATITFTNAKYYNSGESVRVYGGGTMTVSGPNVSRIELTFGTGDGSNAITTNVGTYAESVWTGWSDAVTFTVDGSSGHRKIASVYVQFNGTSGYTVVYSRYITSCQNTTEVEFVPTDELARKMLIGNQIYILLENQLFNLQGQRIK